MATTFDHMRLADLLECHPQDGIVKLHSERVVILSAAALGLLRREVINSVGLDLARRLMMRFGYADGYQDAVSLRDRLAPQDPLEHVRTGPILHTLEGIVHAEVRKMEYDRRTLRFDAEVDWRNSYEAEQHVQLCGPSDGHVCWTLIGYASGYASACFGHEIFFKELQCVGQGADYCAIVGRDAASWGEEAAALRANFAGPPLGEEVERLRAALRKQQHDLARRARLVERREQEIDLLRERVARHTSAKRFVVCSRAMQGVLEQAARIAPLDMTVLIAGESGVGKEFVVRMIHEQSGRNTGSLVSVNCAALTDTLLESELFGHARGAFTGAIREKPGLFETASHGTLFLDEVGEMSPALQAKLLRALQEGEIRRVGAEKTIKVTPRVIAASNRDLRAAIASGSFREDLYFRLGAFVITIPPLRDRREAIPALVHEFCSRAAKRFRKEVPSIDPDAMTRLVNYRWPGNVRELEHAIERAVVLADAAVIQTVHLPAEVSGAQTGSTEEDTLELRHHERALIRRALEKFPHSRQQAAAALRIGTVTLWRKMREYGLHESQHREPQHKGTVRNRLSRVSK